MSVLTPTARVILGMVRMGARTGYEIKSFVDSSTRFFWAASYGQIYPELKRLEREGLIEGQADPHGGRQRRAYRLTPAGEGALRDWLTAPGDLVYELRDEGLLKFFFADALEAEEQLELVRSMRAEHEARLDALEAVRAAKVSAGPPPPGRKFLRRTLESGLRHQRMLVEWCQEMEEELSADVPSAGVTG